MIPLLVLLMVNSAQEPATPKKPAVDAITVTGCLNGTTLTVTKADSADLTGAREYRLRGTRGVMQQLKDYEGHRLEVTGDVKRTTVRGGTDRLETTRKKKVGTKTTVFGGMEAEQSRSDGVDEVSTFELVVTEFASLSPRCADR